jgi:hypothetical protein
MDGVIEIEKRSAAVARTFGSGRCSVSEDRDIVIVTSSIGFDVQN